jgi:hypothetical protein
MLTAPAAIPLPFVAPVPRGNAVTLIGFRRTPDGEGEVIVVVDRTFGVVYADASLSGALGASPAAIDDPVGAVTRFSWAVTRSVTGVSAGALVTYMPPRTMLFMGEESSPYRG